MPRQATSNRVYAEADLDALVPQLAGEVGDRVLRLSRRHPVPGVMMTVEASVSSSAVSTGDLPVLAMPVGVARVTAPSEPKPPAMTDTKERFIART